jgi:hypothetical protein
MELSPPLNQKSKRVATDSPARSHLSFKNQKLVPAIHPGKANGDDG